MPVHHHADERHLVERGLFNYWGYNHLGPTLSLRGIDNATYYRPVPEDKRYYLDFTGCGNTLNMQSPQVLQLIMDSPGYWVLEMHVDGFRFDLASTLAQELYEVGRLERGRPVRGDTLLILLNADQLEVKFALPAIGHHTSWVRILDTIAAHVEERRYPGGATHPLQGRTLALFVLTAERRTKRADQPAEARS